MAFLSVRARPGGRLRRLRVGAAVVGVLLLAGCAWPGAKTSDRSPSAAATASGSTDAPGSAPAASADAPQRLTFTLPLDSTRGYRGTLAFDSPRPQVTLGDPGRVSVSALDGATGTVTNQTEGARPAWLANEHGTGTVGVEVLLAWKMPPVLTSQAVVPAELTASCRGDCEKTGTYLLEQVNLTPAEHSAVQVMVGQPVTLLPDPSPLTTAALGDRQGLAFANGSARAAPDFPESARAALSELLAQPPDVIYLQDGYSSGFRLGGAGDDPMLVACLITGPGQLDVPYTVLGVVVGATGQSLRWPASRAPAGQPCHTSYAGASQ